MSKVIDRHFSPAIIHKTPYRGIVIDELNFPRDQVKLDVLFHCGKSVYQIRIKQENMERESYANLLVLSDQNTWTVIATRKPFGDYGINPLGKDYDDHVYDRIEVEFMDIADDIEFGKDEE